MSQWARAPRQVARGGAPPSMDLSPIGGGGRDPACLHLMRYPFRGYRHWHRRMHAPESLRLPSGLKKKNQMPDVNLITDQPAMDVTPFRHFAPLLHPSHQ